MSLLYKGAIVPDKKKDIEAFLNEVEQFLNRLSSSSGAVGNIKFSIQEAETQNVEWEIEVSGEISYGQDNNGREIWKSSELSNCYSGKTLKEVAEQLFTDIKLHYGDRL